MVTAKLRECPKCGLKQAATKKVCTKCGLVFTRLQPPSRIEDRPSAKDKYKGFQSEPLDPTLIEEGLTPEEPPVLPPEPAFRSRIYRFLSWLFLFVCLAYVGLVYVVGHPVSPEPRPIRTAVEPPPVLGQPPFPSEPATPSSLTPVEKALEIAQAHHIGSLAFALWLFFTLMAVLERIYESIRRAKTESLH